MATQTELRDLDNTIACFVLPKLKAFRTKDVPPPYGMTTQEWKTSLEDMIYAMEAIKSDKCIIDDKRAKRGCKLFGKCLPDLWY